MDFKGVSAERLLLFETGKDAPLEISAAFAAGKAGLEESAGEVHPSALYAFKIVEPNDDLQMKLVRAKSKSKSYTAQKVTHSFFTCSARAQRCPSDQAGYRRVRSRKPNGSRPRSVCA